MCDTHIHSILRKALSSISNCAPPHFHVAPEVGGMDSPCFHPSPWKSACAYSSKTPAPQSSRVPETEDESMGTAYKSVEDFVPDASYSQHIFWKLLLPTTENFLGQKREIR